MRTFTVLTIIAFTGWLAGLKDKTTRRRLATRLRKAELGNLDDVKPVAMASWKCASTSDQAGGCTTSSAGPL